MSVEKRYQLRGVSAEKEDIHNAIKNLDKGCSGRGADDFYTVIQWLTEP